jgi:hypothetical protein
VETLTILRETFTNTLRGSIKENLGRYSQDNPWLSEAAGNAVWKLPTDVVPEEPVDDFVEPSADDLKDLENATHMHKSLPNLTLRQARDPRLWTRLTHVELWPYMRHRWPIERHVSDPAKAVRFIESRYFVAKSESRALLRNGAARLWWSAKLSYDPSRADPYELTAVLLSSLDITQQLLERSLGRAPAVVHGFLDFLRAKGDLLKGGNRSREQIRRLAKFLNLTGGVCVLDCLSKTEITAILEDEYVNIAA